MAKYDDLGYCPADSFKNYSASPLWPRIQEILKDHFNYMVYKREEVNYEFNFLADCIVSCQSTIGLEIAISISILFSKTSMKNKNHIWISDLVTPLGIPEIQYKNGFFETADDSHTLLLEDDRYIVGITLEKNNDVHVYLYRRFSNSKASN